MKPRPAAPVTSRPSSRAAEEWRTVQGRFVDDPSGALEQADTLVSTRASNGDAETEDLGRAMVQYRALFERLLEEDAGTCARRPDGLAPSGGRLYHRRMAMRMPKPGEGTLSRFDELAAAFAPRGAERGQMFGMPVLKVRDKVFAGTFGDAMTFKLSRGDLSKALRLKGVERFEPMPGRAMKEWVLVPADHARRWQALAEQAWSYVAG